MIVWSKGRIAEYIPPVPIITKGILFKDIPFDFLILPSIKQKNMIFRNKLKKKYQFHHGKISALKKIPRLKYRKQERNNLPTRTTAE
jgi:hypothetical protein